MPKLQRYQQVELGHLVLLEGLFHLLEVREQQDDSQVHMLSHSNLDLRYPLKVLYVILRQVLQI